MTNTEVAICYLRNVEAGDLESAIGLADDEATFWTAGPGVMTKAQYRNFIAPVGAMIRTFRFNLTGITTQDDRVAVEAEGFAYLTNGREYRNRYHFLFEFCNGRLHAVREYADSAPAIAAFAPSEG